MAMWTKIDIDKIRALIQDGKYEKLSEMLKPSAEKGDPEAQYWLGYLLFTDADIDEEVSMVWLKKAAEKNHPEAIYEIACMEIDEEKDELNEIGKKMMIRAAELGSVGAQGHLGCLMAVGESGFAKNEIEGRTWYLKSAEQGVANSQYNVGLMMIFGEGGDKDVQTGVMWLKKSAVNSEPDGSSLQAAKCLVELYEQGLHGEEVDNEKATMWKMKADEIEQIQKNKLRLHKKRAS